MQIAAQLTIESGEQEITTPVISRKFSFQPQHKESELEKDAMLVKKLMCLNKRYKRMDLSDQPLLPAYAEETQQSCLRKLFNQVTSPNMASLLRSPSHLLFNNTTLYRKCSDNMSDVQNDIRSSLLGFHSAFKPVERKFLPSNSSSRITPPPLNPFIPPFSYGQKLVTNEGPHSNEYYGAPFMLKDHHQ